MIILIRSLFLLSCLLFTLMADAKNITGACGDTVFKQYKTISQIQGSHLESTASTHWPSPFIDQWVVVEGIVTLDKSKEYQGFWLQQETLSSALVNASFGIFVYHGRDNIKRGQRIRLLALVAEYHGVTELKQVKALIVCASHQALPKASLLSLPVKSLAELEALEGMRVRLKQSLLVSDLFGAGYGLAKYGQFAISSRLHFQPTELDTAQTILLDNEKHKRNNKRLDYLLLDDGHAARFPKFIPFPNDKGFSADNPLRIGDKLNQISAILHSYGEHYILIPEPLEAEVAINMQPRPVRPKISAQANVVLASMNVENYFNGKPQSFSNRDVGFPTSRGANSYQQFIMQTQKLVAALSIIDADVIAIMELENDGYGEHSAIADLTRALNKKFTVDKHYRYIVPNSKQSSKLNESSKLNTLGKDEISVGILYRSSKAKPIGTVKILDSSSSVKARNSKGRMRALFNDGFNRPSLLQQFMINGKYFYIAVNHFKSKGRPCGKAKADAVQGHCNRERTRAATALGEFINIQVENSIPVLIMGDLNSYSQEDPLLVLADAGFQNLNTLKRINEQTTVKESLFSYSFQGYLGNLDHALANKAMLPFIRSIDSWHINSVEDTLLKYDTQYAVPDAYRSSDHDPLVIGIQF